MEATQELTKPPIKKERIKIVGLKQLFNKKHKVLEKFAAKWKPHLGMVEDCCIIFIWGNSGSGKSELLMQLVKDISDEGNVLYVGLEEKTRMTMKERAKRYLSEEMHSGKIKWWDDKPNHELLLKYLRKKKSAKIVVIDSINYLRILYSEYVHMKEEFKKKIFIINAHASGKEPKGSTAYSIRYDADIKIRVEGKVAFPDSRYFGGGQNVIIWPEGAKKYWNQKEMSAIKSGKKL